MRSPRPRTWAALGGGLLVVIVGSLLVYVAISGLLARNAAEVMRASLTSAQESVGSGDLPQAATFVDQAEAAALDVLRWTGGPVWVGVEAMPWIGPQVSAARALATTVEETTAAAKPLIDVARTGADVGLRTPEGGIDIAALERLGPALSATASAVRAGEDRLAGTPSVNPEVDAGISEARGLLVAQAGRLDRAAEAVALLPGMLGADGPRTWAVMLQNAAEMRGSGGLLGAYALVTVDAGRITLDEAGARKSGLDGDPIPVKEIADESQVSTWGVSNLEDWASYNLSVDFPFVAELTAAGMAARGTPVDGVAALDARVVAGVLAGTDSVAAGPLSINAGNAEDVFTRDIYALIPDVQEKDAVTVALLQATLDAALTRPLNLPRMLTSLADPVRGGHLRLWSADPTEERWLLATPLGGALPEDPGPSVIIGINNTAGSKLDRYLSLEADYRVGICPGEEMARSTLELSLANTAPADLPDYVTIRLDDTAAPTGSTSLQLSVYAPVDAFIESATLDGEPVDIAVGRERNRTIWGFRIDLDRGQNAALRLDFVEPQVPGAAPTLTLPPLVEDPGIQTWAGALPDQECGLP